MTIERAAVLNDSDPAGSADVCGFRFATVCRSADGVSGGDFFEVVPRGPGRVQVIIGDACGRGEPAAKLVAHLRPLIRSMDGAPAELLAKLNDAVYVELDEDAFITVACLELDVRNSMIRVSNAGHVPPVVRRALGSNVIVGRASGPPLGMVPHATYETETKLLLPGDAVVLMTDGLLEAFEEDLIDMRSLREHLSLAPNDVGRLNESLLARVSDSRERDDMTVVSVSCPTHSDDRWQEVRPSLY